MRKYFVVLGGCAAYLYGVLSTEHANGVVMSPAGFLFGMSVVAAISLAVHALYEHFEYEALKELAKYGKTDPEWDEAFSSPEIEALWKEGGYFESTEAIMKGGMENE